MGKIDNQLIIKFYTYFYKKRYNIFNYKYKQNEKDNELIIKFIDSLNKRYLGSFLGDEFLWRYFMYQMNYLRNSELKGTKGKFTLLHIIGTRAFNRFFSTELDDHWVIDHSDVIRLYNFRKSDLIAPNRMLNYQSSFEESNKLKYYNTDEGFYHCIVTTTLYDKASAACTSCIFKIECEQVLKENFKSLYERRTNKNDN